MATSFLWSTGNASSTVVGLLSTAPITLMGGTTGSNDISSMSSGAVRVSTTNNTGLFGSTLLAQGIWADLFYSPGSLASTVTWTFGSNLSGWFLDSGDQTSFENSTGILPARGPDFIVALPAALAPANSVFAVRMVMLPALPFRVLIQANTTGVTPLSSGKPYLKAAPFAMRY